MKPTAALSLELLKSILDYDQETGLFGWKERRGRKRNVAGSLGPSGYILVGVLMKKYLAHRLAWFWMTGSWPVEIDHINGVRSDNRWVNLRDGTRTLNLQNLKLDSKTNQTGLLGAQLDKRRGTFYSRIRVNGDVRWLGYFDTAHEAHTAYISAKRRFHPFGML